MGKLLRFSVDGPRLISEDSDCRQDGEPMVIQNQSPISAQAHFDPIVDLDRHEKLIATLNKRGGSQRGKPRSRDPNKNPLGARIFDMNCCWPMYRSPSGDSYRYCCGQYMQTHGQQCSSNYVPGPAATRFVLACIRQLISAPGLMSRIKERLRALAADHLPKHKPTATPALTVELATVSANLEAAKRLKNLAQDQAQRTAITAMVKDLQERHEALQAGIAASTAENGALSNVDTEVQKALTLVQQIDQLAADADNLAAVTKLFNLVNARLFLSFVSLRPKKRVVNRIRGGVITFGTAPAPIEIYNGRTSRQDVKKSTMAVDAVTPGAETLPGIFPCTGKGESIGNVNRGDWI